MLVIKNRHFVSECSLLISKLLIVRPYWKKLPRGFGQKKSTIITIDRIFELSCLSGFRTYVTENSLGEPAVSVPNFY